MQSISLIANSGIQFHTVDVNLSEKSAAMSTRSITCELVEEDAFGNREINFVEPSDIYYLEKSDKYIQKKSINADAIDARGVVNEDKVQLATVRELREDMITFASAREAMDVFENTWLPLPYFRQGFYEANDIHQGPETWARVLISKIMSNEAETPNATHKITLAFDTNCRKAAEVNTVQELVPCFITDDNVEDSIRFTCAVDDTKNLFWIGRDWTQDWLENTVKSKRKLLERKYHNFDELRFLHISLYMVLLKTLEKASAFPQVSLHKNPRSIEVDLVLDVGNSRTCGLVIESQTGNPVLNITDAKPLQIRYLTKPHKTYSNPFEMKLAFVKEVFGEESAAMLSGNPYAFNYPSIVRIGAEAVDLSALYDSTSGNCIFSSPKRYLWDSRERLMPWHLIPLSNEPFSQPALHGVTNLFTQDGRLLSRANKESADRGGGLVFAGFTPLYSHSSLMTFSLIEIFMQALTYINSYEYRQPRPQPNAPRKLKRIVLTCPTAMLKTEKYILRRAAQDAVKALTEYFKDLFDVDLQIIPDPDEVIKPDLEENDLPQLDHLPIKGPNSKRLEWGFDEATCSQLTFIFSEIVERFKNENVKTYFDVVGKKREGSKYPDSPSVTLASIDIGGGTTDLMICSYQTDPESDIPVLSPEPLFWEGFNLAGDNILKRLIEQILLPSIQQHAVSLGCRHDTQLMSELFGRYFNDQSTQDRLMKRYFVNQIALPITYGIMQFAVDNKGIELRDFDSFFKDYNFPNSQLVEHINKTFVRNGAVGFDIRDVKWLLDVRLINQVVNNVVEKMLGDLCRIIVQYDCDYVLLSGRPTTLPVIKDILLKYAPTTPDRIISLGNYRVGNWYPFAKGGMIRDPKTCVVVGAAIALMSGTLVRMDGFRIDRNLLANKVVSTADYIGLYEESAARIRTVYFQPNQTDFTVQFHDTLLVGMRQMPTSDWIASLMYRLSFANHTVARELAHRLPLSITLKIKDPYKDKEKITIQSVLDRMGVPVEAAKISLQLQTLTDEYGYWLDTGIFNLDIVGRIA